MGDENQTWHEVSRLFDELIELAPEERARRLDGIDSDPEVRAWLESLFAVHEAPDPSILDETLTGIVRRMTADEADARRWHLPGDLTGERFGYWEVTDKIASGSMGSVMKCERADGAYDQQAAIKLLRPGPFGERDRERLQEELRLLARLEHPHIARLLDGGITGRGWPYLVMEYVDGMPIDDWCRHHRLGLRQRLSLLIRVAGAIEYAHTRLVVHADIKPSNVLVDKNGEPRLVDFGISSLMRESDHDASGPGAFLHCSPAYAAPEQIRGERPATGHDVFAFGALAYELLTGRRLRDGQSVTSAVLGREDEKCFPPPSRAQPGIFPPQWLRGDIDAIVLKALAQDVEHRYDAIHKAGDDLKRYLGSKPVAARDGGRYYHFSRWLRRNRLAAGAAAAVFVSLVIGIGAASWQASIAQENADRAEAVQDFLLRIFQAADPVANQQNPLLVNDLVDRQAERLNRSMAEEPALRRELRFTLARVQQNLGNNSQALSIYRRLLQDSDEAEDPVRAAELHVRIAEQLEALGRLNEALEHAREGTRIAALDRRVSAVAVDAARRQASILTELRRNPEAMELLEEALAYRDAIIGLANGPALLGGLLSDLSEKYGVKGETETALERHAESVRLFRRAYPEAHPDIANAYARLAAIHRAAGNFGKAALASFDSALETRRIFGARHTQSLRNETALAVDLAYLSCQRLAVEFYSGLIERYEDTYGEDNVMTANALLNLASMRRKIGSYWPALEEINRTISIYDAQPEPVTDMRAFALGIRAQLLFALDEHAGAIESSEQALEVMKNAVGEGHPQSLRIQVSHGNLLRELGHYEQAEDYLKPAYEKLREVLGQASSHTQDAATKLAAVYKQSGQAALLESLVDDAGLGEDRIGALIASSPQGGVSSDSCDKPETVDLERLETA